MGARTTTTSHPPRPRHASHVDPNQEPKEPQDRHKETNSANRSPEQASKQTSTQTTISSRSNHPPLIFYKGSPYHSQPVSAAAVFPSTLSTHDIKAWQVPESLKAKSEK
ncbi:hypothetical protein VTJ04DRAFT_3494 [Mycothermus thermophilus]|uniref:uncharacterized protein n=1 Tax=Humicola insolens TaxID=85995 RepID=UPI003743EEE1